VVLDTSSFVRFFFPFNEIVYLTFDVDVLLDLRQISFTPTSVLVSIIECFSLLVAGH